MDLDDFIIAVFCVVDEAVSWEIAGHRTRQRGPHDHRRAAGARLGQVRKVRLSLLVSEPRRSCGLSGRCHQATRLAR